MCQYVINNILPLKGIFNYTESHRENVEDHRVKPLGNSVPPLSISV
jgi:hypothetical protein